MIPTSNSNDNDNERAKDARRKTSRKKGSTQLRPDLTEAEAMFLRALLIDNPPLDESAHSEETASSTKVFDDHILFSLPFQQGTEPPKQRHANLLLGLWHAFEDGVRPGALVSHASSPQQKELEKLTVDKDDESVVSIRSDEEVRVSRDTVEDNLSSCSSWKEEDGGREHYDSWEVLRDEYAEDFGFDYKERITPELDENEDHHFRILGTSANDVAAHPHVLSPPLMDALMSFLPETLENQNFWLKYSLVRDGSSMNTLKQYVRASTNNILAIETITGEVFGAFTTSPWRTQLGFFGTGEGTFLWRMRHNRNMPCHSLFEQAQMETEIDVYAYSGLNTLVQHCSHDNIGIGGGDINKYKSDEVGVPPPLDIEQMKGVGFGIMINEDLSRGSTSPCATFRNPDLMNNSGQLTTFTIANMEVWTLTPAWDVNSAQRLEMVKYFSGQSLRQSMRQSTHTYADEVSSTHSSVGSDFGSCSIQGTPVFTSTDLIQEKFYRRVGEHDENESQRNHWQYANMMNLS